MLFPWYIKYPNQNDEILNLDWILSTIDNLVNEVSNFVTLNTIKYADPIQWNITTQYEKNTVVIDPISGSAYISTKPVPAGVGLNNTDYWNIIFTLDVISANKNLTLRDDANNMLATFESSIGDWLLWQGTLYKVIRDIAIGQAYVDDYNLTRYTVEMYIKDYITFVINLIGDLDDLTTTEKATIVGAINELKSAIDTTSGDLSDLATSVGNLDDLTTSDKDSIVDAINELVSSLTTLDDKLGDLDDLVTTDKDSAVDAINELAGEIISLKEAKNVYELVSDMVADTSLTAGDIVATLGYHAAGVGGCIYLISDTTGTGAITLSNGKYALPEFRDEIKLSQLGLQSGGDISSLLVTAYTLLNHRGIIVIDYDCKIDSTVTLNLSNDDDITIDGREHNIQINSTPGITINCSNYGYNCNFINCDFQAGNTGITALKYLSHGSSLNRSKIHNCNFTSSFTCAIQFDNSRMFDIQNISVWDIPSNGIGLQLYAHDNGFCGDFEIQNSQFSVADSSTSTKEIDLLIVEGSSAAGISIHDNDFYGIGDKAISFMQNGNVSDIWIINNQFDRQFDCDIYAYSTSASPYFINWHIKGNYSTGPKEFISFYIPNGRADAFDIEGNYIIGNNRDNNTIYFRIGTTASCNIVNNKFINCGSNNGATVRIDSVENLIITGNMFDLGSGVYTVKHIEVNDSTRVICCNNLGYNSTGTAFDLVNCTTNVKANNIP